MDSLVYLVGILLLTAPGKAADFRVRPSDSTVTAGQSHTLRCGIASGYQKNKQHVYWAWTGLRNQQRFLSVDRALYDAKGGGRYSIAGSVNDGDFNLHIAAVSVEDAGEYQCILYDSTGGSSRATARLLVQESRLPNKGYPRCSITPANPQPGDYATFACVSAGGAPPATLSWSGRAKTEAPVHHNSTGTETGAYLHKLLTGWDNNVTYTCTSSSSGVETLGSCSLVPFEIPTHVTVMSPQMVTVGDSADFFCLVKSAPSSVHFRWLIGRGRSITRVTRTKGRYVIGDEGASLRILNVTQADDDMPVRCVARNPLEMKGIDENVLRVVADRNPPATTEPTTRPLPTSTKPRPTTAAKSQPTTPRTIIRLNPVTPSRINTVRVPTSRQQSPVPPAQPALQTAPWQPSLTQSPRPRNSAATIPATTNKMEKPVSASPPTGEMVTTHLPPNSVLQPGPKTTGKGYSAGAAVGFTVLVLIVLVLVGILVKIKFVDKHQEAPVKKKNLRPVNKPRIDKLDIVVVPNAVPETHDSTTDGDTDGGDAPGPKQKQESVKSTKTPRRQSFVHPDFLEQLASTIRSKSHCSSMFKKSSFNWRKRKATTLDRPVAVKTDSVPAEAEGTSTVKRYSAFFNAVPPVQGDDYPVPSPRRVQQTESVYENTEIGFRLQEEAIRISSESPYENTQCPMRSAPPSSADPEKRKSEASSLLNLVYADLDWTGFPSRHDDVNDAEDKTEYAAIRASQAL